MYVPCVYWTTGEMLAVTMSLVELTGKLARLPVRCWLMREGGGDEGGGETEASLSPSSVAHG